MAWARLEELKREAAMVHLKRMAVLGLWAFLGLAGAGSSAAEKAELRGTGQFES